MLSNFAQTNQIHSDICNNHLQLYQSYYCSDKHRCIPKPLRHNNSLYLDHILYVLYLMIQHKNPYHQTIHLNRHFHHRRCHHNGLRFDKFLYQFRHPCKLHSIHRFHNLHRNLSRHHYY